MTRPYRSYPLILALLLAAGLSGCGLLGRAPGQATARERQQAEEALARWAAAAAAGGGQQAFTPVGELTGQIGDWELEVGGNNKSALMAGMVVAAAELSSDSPGDGEVRWDDGTTKTLPTISAEQALQELRAAGGQDCPECVPLEVTAARLSRATFQTSRGPASAPAWEFTVKGTNVLVTRVAVAAQDGIVVQPPPWDPNNAPTGISVESASGTVGGTELTVAFTGAPDTGDKPCGADYTAEAVESDTAVVIIVIPHEQGFGGACSAVGARRTATVELAGPLGERAVLEVKEGLPVPVLLTP
jgi:hypothetical protein